MKRAGAATTVLALFVALAACGDRALPPADSGDVDARRIVTLAPNLAELVFAVGAGDRLVGVSAYTDFPEEAAALPAVGDAFNVDLEQLALLRPDLLLAWDTGTPAHVVEELRTRGHRVTVIRTASLADVSAAMLEIGRLTGHEVQAAEAARAFESGLSGLERRYRDKGPIRVFYQVDARPLYTINGRHFLSEVIELCGGVNIFHDLEGLAPLISTEAVLERDPEVLLASSDAGPGAFDAWNRWTDLSANRYGNRFRMPAAETGRATPRLLTGARAVCEALATGRRNREARQMGDSP